MTIFYISKFVFSASIQLSGNQRTYLYSGLSIDIHFVDIELSYDVLSPLPIVLSKHFNHPHPYIEIATAISDVGICFHRFLKSKSCFLSFFTNPYIQNHFKMNYLYTKEYGIHSSERSYRVTHSTEQWLVKEDYMTVTLRVRKTILQL